MTLGDSKPTVAKGVETTCFEDMRVPTDAPSVVYTKQIEWETSVTLANRPFRNVTGVYCAVGGWLYAVGATKDIRPNIPINPEARAAVNRHRYMALGLRLFDRETAVIKVTHWQYVGGGDSLEDAFQACYDDMADRLGVSFEEQTSQAGGVDAQATLESLAKQEQVTLEHSAKAQAPKHSGKGGR